ncbi:MAG TPA: tyrosine-type recombinase/integrase [Gemmataceae bacterium]|jgi:integrase
MNLHELIERYIAYRQALGEPFKTNASILRAFGHAIGVDAAVVDVRPEQVEAFLAPVTSAWYIKHSALLGFYRYALNRGYVAASPLPRVLPQRPPPFVPYIYDHDELRRLVQATDCYLRRPSRVEPITIRTIVLLLYGTGLRVHEAVALNHEDIDWPNALLTIRHTKFYKSRLVPFSQSLGRILAAYATRRGTTGFVPPGTPFFTRRNGMRVLRGTLEDCFRRLCEQAGIRRTDGARYQPRLHDLRHSFAVHRLISWYRQGADVQKLLPMLSVYLGHAYLAATQVYLSMTPELLAEANGRFERYAGKEGFHE